MHHSVASRVLLEGPSSSRLCLWLRVRAGAGAGEDLFIGGIYLPPTNSNSWGGAAGTPTQAFATLRNHTLAFQARGRALLMGDFNARVGCRRDIQPAVEELLARTGGGPDAVSLGVPAERRTLDTTPPNQFGKLLLDSLCLPTGLVLLNGRAPATVTANDGWTFEPTGAHAGRSCVDYALADPRLYSRVQSFDLLPHSGLSDHHVLICTLAPLTPTPRPAAPCGMAPPTLRLSTDEGQREAYVALLEAAGSLAAEALDGAATAAAVTEAIRTAAVTAFGPPRPRRCEAVSTPAAARREAPWFRYCRRAHFNLQDALHRRLDPGEARRWRNLFNAQKRRAQRHLRARRNESLLHTLRRDPRRFWSSFKANDAAPAGAAHTLAELRQHWSALFGGAGRGALEEGGDEDAAALAHRLAAEAAGRENWPDGRRAAAAVLNATITAGEVIEQLRRMRAGAAAGADGLGADLLKGAWRWEQDGEGRRYRFNVLAAPLATALERIFRCRYPLLWNDQPLTSVHKGKGAGPTCLR